MNKVTICISKYNHSEGAYNPTKSHELPRRVHGPRVCGGKVEAPETLD